MLAILKSLWLMFLVVTLTLGCCFVILLLRIYACLRGVPLYQNLGHQSIYLGLNLSISGARPGRRRGCAGTRSTACFHRERWQGNSYSSRYSSTRNFNITYVISGSACIPPPAVGAVIVETGALPSLVPLVPLAAVGAVQKTVLEIGEIDAFAPPALRLKK